MKKVYRLLGLVMALLMLLTGCQQGNSNTPGGGVSTESPYDQRDTVRVGLVCSRTGNKKVNGDFIFEAATLAVEEINAAGGVLGKQVELVVEDEMETQQDAINAVNRLLSNGDITALAGCVVSTNAIAVSPSIAQYQVPMLAMGSSYHIVEEENPFMWQTRVTDDKVGELFADAAVNFLGMKNPAILNSTDSFGQGLADSTMAALEKMGIEPAIVVKFNVGEKQFVPFLTQIVNSGADGVIASASESALIMTQVYDMGLMEDLTFIGSGGFIGSWGRATAGEAANGWYGCNDWADNVQREEGIRFTEAYKERWGRDIVDMVAAASYDSIHLICEAIEIAGTADPIKVNDALGQIKDHPGALCTQTAQESHSFGTQYLLVQTRDGAATAIDTLDVPVS